jgi:hypothetical protein
MDGILFAGGDDGLFDLLVNRAGNTTGLDVYIVTAPLPHLSTVHMNRVPMFTPFERS